MFCRLRDITIYWSKICFCRSPFPFTFEALSTDRPTPWHSKSWSHTKLEFLGYPTLETT